MVIFTKVSSLGRKLIYFFDFLLTTLFFRFKKFLTALVRIFRRRMIYREPYPTKADPIWCIRRRLPTPPHHRIHGAAEKNSTTRFPLLFSALPPPRIVFRTQIFTRPGKPTRFSLSDLLNSFFLILRKINFFSFLKVLPSSSWRSEDAI